MKPVYVGLVSDSHGRFKALEKMVEQAPDVAAWIHCGDYCDDADDLEAYTGLPVYAVLGNNDFRCRTDAPECRKVTVGGVVFVAVHGHQWYGQRRLEKLRRLGEEQGASLVVFGHTHRKLLEKADGLTIVNPGSIALPRDGRRGTYAVCAVESGVLKDVMFYEI